MSKNDDIGVMRSIIERLIPDCSQSNICNYQGHELSNDHIVSQIDTEGGYHRIIMRWSLNIEMN